MLVYNYKWFYNYSTNAKLKLHTLNTDYIKWQYILHKMVMYTRFTLLFKNIISTKQRVVCYLFKFVSEYVVKEIPLASRTLPCY